MAYSPFPMPFSRASAWSGQPGRLLLYLESLLPTGLLLPVWLALTEVELLLNMSLLLALLPASLPPLKHSIAWNFACR